MCVGDNQMRILEYTYIMYDIQERDSGLVVQHGKVVTVVINQLNHHIICFASTHFSHTLCEKAISTKTHV